MNDKINKGNIKQPGHVRSSWVILGHPGLSLGHLGVILGHS